MKLKMEEGNEKHNGKDTFSKVVKAAMRCIVLFATILEKMEKTKEEQKQFEEQEDLIQATSEWDAETFDWEFSDDNT